MNEILMDPSSNISKPAGFWMRFAAMLLDQTLLGFIIGTFVFVACIVALLFTSLTIEELLLFFEQIEALGNSEIDTSHLEGTMTEMLYALQAPIYILCSVFYHAIGEISRLRGSIGKFILRIEVVQSNRASLSAGRALARNSLAWILGIITLTINHWIAGFGKDKRALHDRVSGCRVVYR